MCSTCIHNSYTCIYIIYVYRIFAFFISLYRYIYIYFFFIFLYLYVRWLQNNSIGISCTAILHLACTMTRVLHNSWPHLHWHKKSQDQRECVRINFFFDFASRTATEITTDLINVVIKLCLKFATIAIVILLESNYFQIFFCVMLLNLIDQINFNRWMQCNDEIFFNYQRV